MNTELEQPAPREKQLTEYTERDTHTWGKSYVNSRTNRLASSQVVSGAPCLHYVELHKCQFMIGGVSFYAELCAAGCVKSSDVDAVVDAWCTESQVPETFNKV